MADLIQIKGGSGDVPALQDRELAYRKNEKALYIGTNGTKGGNVKLCDGAYGNRIKALEEGQYHAGMFYATYGVTTADEIAAEFQAGKGIVCKIPDGEYKGRILWLNRDSSTSATNYFEFAGFDNNYLFYQVYVSASRWGGISVTPLARAETVNALLDEIETIKKRLDDLEEPM